MNLKADAAFASIESAQEYLSLLAQVIVESQQSVQADIQEQTEAGSARHLEAVRLIGYKLETLGHHIKASRQILNDLRMLRRILR